MWPGRTASLAISRGTTTTRLSTAYVHPHYHALQYFKTLLRSIQQMNGVRTNPVTVLLYQSAKFQDCTFYAVWKKSNQISTHSITQSQTMWTSAVQTDTRLFFRTTRVSWHQKGETNLDFNDTRDDGVAVASTEPCANHLHLAPDRWPHQRLIIQFFTGQMLFLTPNQQSKHWSCSQE